MNAIVSTYHELRDDEDGASFIEYTVLLGVILAVSVLIIYAVGNWAAAVWTNLNSAVRT